MTSQEIRLRGVTDARLERPSLAKADVVCLAGMLQRAAVCLDLYKRGHKDRARYWCNDDLMNFLKGPDEYVTGQVRSINSLAQLHNIARHGNGELDRDLLRHYQSLFKQLLTMLRKIKEDSEIIVGDDVLNKIKAATAQLNHFYITCE